MIAPGGASQCAWVLVDTPGPRGTVRGMPIYKYYCAANGTAAEVHHGMREDLRTWGELCARLGQPLGDTPAEASVERILYAPALHTPTGDSALKSQGFTKLVRREQGVYENVTATGDEKRYVRADDPSSMPDFKRKVGD